MTFETLDVASLDLAEARAKIDAARVRLLKAGENPSGRAAIQRLDRIEAKLKRVEVAMTGVGRGGESRSADRSRGQG